MEIKATSLEANKLGISIVDLIYLKLLENNLALIINMQKLKELGYINSDTGELSKNFNSIVKDDYYYFVEAYKEYPHKAGSRVLKALSLDSSDFKFCEKKYQKYFLRDPYVGYKMYLGITKEIILRKNSNSQEFQQDIRTWFGEGPKGQSWEKYYDLEDVNENTTQNTDII